MKVGDTVKLHSGGSTMTVIDIEKDKHCKCAWWSSVQMYYKSEQFPPAALRMVPSGE